jgi:PAS domain S-box-containing protein
MTEDNSRDPKREELALRASEHHLRKVLDSLFAFVGVLTPSGILIEVNRTALEAGGLLPEEVLGKRFEDSYWWSYSTQVQSQLREAIERAARGESSRYDVKIRIRENRLITVDFMLSPLLDDEGEVTHLVPSAIDITERRQAEDAAEKSAARERVRAQELETLLRATPAAIWIAHDTECRQITGNPASYRLLRMPENSNASASASPSEAPLRSFQEFRGNVPVPPHELPVQMAASQGIEVQGAELTLRFNDGDERHIYGNASPLRGPDGAVYGAISAFIDITERKRAEEALMDADRRKDEFLAMLAHELRNPLAAIRSAAHLLKLKGTDEASLSWSRDVIERQVKQLTRLIEDLLDVSRINSGKIKLRRDLLDVRQIIARSVEAVRPLFDAKQHKLEVLPTPQGMPVKADPARLEQVIGNVLTNAAKYTDNGGLISLSGVLEGSWVVIRVRDNGIGIAPHMLPQVFDLFTQVKSTPDRSQGGLGLGLSLVKTLVELHGGTVYAASDGPGQGSEFTIRLPASLEES